MLNETLYHIDILIKTEVLSSEFCNLHSIYTRMSRWRRNGVLEWIFKNLQQEQMICLNAYSFSIDMKQCP